MHQGAIIRKEMSNGDSAYHPRLIEPALAELAEELSALMIVGPRAVGKTTTLGRRAATTSSPPTCT
jgi:predicted AAA+ superfamily ATPase